jgi:hypothetical protein
MQSLTPQQESRQPAHVSAIGPLLMRLYAVISFQEGEEPDWGGLAEVFSEHARITRMTPEGTDYMDLRSFLAMTRSLFEAGAYTSFYEIEVARRIEHFGNMAQVWSVYETRRNRDAREALGRGVNSIQVIREGDAWRVLALLWDETHASAHSDVEGLFAKDVSRGQD